MTIPLFVALCLPFGDWCVQSSPDLITWTDRVEVIVVDPGHYLKVEVMFPAVNDREFFRAL
jgi:hypothetical protein